MKLTAGVSFGPKASVSGAGALVGVGLGQGRWIRSGPDCSSASYNRLTENELGNTTASRNDLHNDSLLNAVEV